MWIRFKQNSNLCRVWDNFGKMAQLRIIHFILDWSSWGIWEWLYTGVIMLLITYIEYTHFTLKVFEKKYLELFCLIIFFHKIWELQEFSTFFIDESLRYVTKKCIVILWIDKMLYKRFLKYTSILMIIYLSVAYGTKYNGIFKFNAAPFLRFLRSSCQILYLFVSQKLKALSLFIL